MRIKTFVKEAHTYVMSALFLRHAAVLPALLVWAAAAWAQMAVEVIPLKYRMAEEVIPALQPLLVQEGSLSGLRGQLVLRTTPSNLRDIQRVLATIDVPPKRLLVSVAQATLSDTRRRGIELSGTLRADDQLRMTLPGTVPMPRDGVQ